MSQFDVDRVRANEEVSLNSSRGMVRLSKGRNLLHVALSVGPLTLVWCGAQDASTSMRGVAQIEDGFGDDEIGEDRFDSFIRDDSTAAAP